MEGRISVRIQLGKTDARGGESMAVGEETCEMQLLLEILPEAEREKEKYPGCSLPPTHMARLAASRWPIWNSVDVAACWCWQSGRRARNGVEGRQAQAQHQAAGLIFHFGEPDSPSRKWG